MITLDVALLNTGNTPIFIHKLDFPSVELTERDEQGGEAHIRLDATILEGITSESYSLLQPHGMLVKSFLIFTKCADSDRIAHIQARLKLDEDERDRHVEYQKALFDRNLFVNWGDACLDISGPGAHLITAQVSNDHVMVSSAGPKLRTAVGTIRTSPLRVTIVK
jgi:hypothetical protein